MQFKAKIKMTSHKTAKIQNNFRNEMNGNFVFCDRQKSIPLPHA